MLKNKNFLVSMRVEYSMSQFYVSRLPRLRRSRYFINRHKSINYKDDESSYELQLKSINFDLLVVFYTVVMVGSVTKASKHLSVSQPSISMSLRKLEKEIGILLVKPFISNHKVLVLTPFGLVLFNRIQRLFQIVEESLNFSTLQVSSLITNKLSSTQSKYKSLILLKQVNKKYLFNFSNNSVLFKIFYRNLTCFHKLNFKYFENNSSFIILKKSQLSDKKIKLLKTQTLLSESFSLDKFPSFKALNGEIFSSMDNRKTIELQTKNAVNVASDLNISNLICWGSYI